MPRETERTVCRLVAVVWMIAAGWGLPRPAFAQAADGGAANAVQPDPAQPNDAAGGDDAAARAREGYLLQVALPIRSEGAAALRRELEQLAAAVEGRAAGRRTPVVLQFGSPSAAAEEADGRGSSFEASLSLARWLTGRGARSLRVVAYVAGPVEGHAVLPVLACDEFVVAPTARLGNAQADEAETEEAIALVYGAIAAGRGVVPPAVVQAMVDRELELVHVTQIDGTERFVAGEELAELRAAGEAWKETQLSEAGRPAVFSADQLRSYRWASQVVDSRDALAQWLGVSRFRTPSATDAGTRGAVRLDVSGPINGSRVRRFESNIVAALDSDEVDSLFVTIDSPGGDLGSSLQLAYAVADLIARPGAAIGYVEGAARGDAALVAVACKPLYLHRQARLGGGGAQRIEPGEVRDLREAIEQLAEQTGRSAALLVGLIDPEAQVYRYTHRRTGQVAYFEGDRLKEGEAEQWQRGDRIGMADGISAAEAVALGLAEGEADSASLAARRGGLEDVPRPLSDRRVVHAVEWLGGLPGLAPLLLFLGFLALSVEMSAPGLGLPGFISLLCFIMFFWMKFLSGTAEWLEVTLFVGGVLCILLEVLVVPGVGVFGIGGITMVVAAIVLASQTFVIPRNAYQYAQTTRGLLTVLAACGGIVGGLAVLRFLLPGMPMFGQLVMPGPDSDEMIEQEQREHLVHYEWLLGREGVAVTPLRPAGKARFDDQIVAVISDGSPVSSGEPLRVIEVHGNRVVVEPA